MPWSEHARVMAARRRWAAVDVAVTTADGFRRHQSGRNAASLAYYGFLTLFPLLLVATTILGFVLDDRPDLQADIVDTALGQIPVIGPSLEPGRTIGGNWWALTVGLAVALWGSLRAFVGMQAALDDVWEVGIDARANGALQRLKALIGIAVIGLGQIGAVVLAALVSTAGLPRTGDMLIVVGGLALNALVVGSMYRFLTSYPTTWAMIWPGAALTATVYTVLQFAGTELMTSSLADAESVYGPFAGTLALLTWLSLHALVSLVGAELNAALAGPRAGDIAHDESPAFESPASAQ